jgi:hypothetical protein
MRRDSRWDDALADDLPGKLVLVGLTYFDSSGRFVEEQQFFGRVVFAHPTNGILLNLEGRRAGEQYTLPPDMRSLRRSSAGAYRLRSTGEVVVDADFTVIFSFHQQSGTSD